jgi:hypothetical protein
MSQPCSDDLYIHALFQKANLRGMAEDVRRRHDRTTNILVDCESKSWSEMAIAAVFAELRVDANAPSLFIIPYRENPYSIL